MTTEPKRVVTGVDADGTSVVLHDAPLEPVGIGLMPGAQFVRVWGTESGPSGPMVLPAEPIPHFFPGRGGTRFGLLTFPPATADEIAVSVSDEEADTLAAEAANVLPGLMDVFEPDAPGMHQTATVDYCVVVSGELYLELDNGVEVALPAGSVVVQNGARHAWRNHGLAPATLAYVIFAL
jgi:quercetin dioxygenase-like cupin family protein